MTTTTATHPTRTAGGDTSTTVSTEPVTLRLGYFPNVTHSPAVVGVEHGDFEDALGDNVNLELSTFNAGPAAVEAIFGGALDATFIGPNPAINAYAAVERRSDPHRLGHRLRWRVPRREARDHERRRTWRARSSPRRSSATRRTSRCAPG